MGQWFNKSMSHISPFPFGQVSQCELCGEEQGQIVMGENWYGRYNQFFTPAGLRYKCLKAS